MSENLRKFVKAAYAMDAVVARTPAEAWSRQSPCDDWTAAEVLGHIVWSLRKITADAAGEPKPADQAEADVAGDDPGATWTAALDAALTALDRPGSLQREVNGAFGPMSLDSMLGFAPGDMLAHAWDIATTAGLDAHLPSDLCEFYAAGIAAAGDRVRGPGMMAPAVDVPADADAATRFIAQTGRTP